MVGHPFLSPLRVLVLLSGILLITIAIGKKRDPVHRMRSTWGIAAIAGGMVVVSSFFPRRSVSTMAQHLPLRRHQLQFSFGGYHEL